MPSRPLPLVKGVIRGLRLDAARTLADEALQAGSTAQVLDLCRETLGQAVPELRDFIRS
jgi:hypothetical protein